MMMKSKARSATAALLVTAAVAVPASAADDCSKTSEWKKPAGDLWVEVRNRSTAYLWVNKWGGGIVRVDSGNETDVVKGRQLGDGERQFTVKTQSNAQYESGSGKFEIATFGFQVEKPEGGKGRSKFIPGDMSQRLSCDRQWVDSKNRWHLVYTFR